MKKTDFDFGDFRAQHYTYSAEDHKTWAYLFAKASATAEKVATADFLTSLAAINFPADRVPRYSELNANPALLGAKIAVIEGWLENGQYFGMFQNNLLPSTDFIRKPHERDFTEMPDLYHDIFGHVPLCVNPTIAAFQRKMGALGVQAVRANDAEALDWVARVWWWTVEFGVMLENGKVKAWSAGCLSSPMEALHCVSNKANHWQWNLLRATMTPIVVDGVQHQYFVLDDISQLESIANGLEKTLQRKFQTELIG